MIGFLAAIVLVLLGGCCRLGIFKAIIKALFAFSCGALIGDAMVHILSEAYDEGSGAKPIFVSLVFCLTILAFIWLERLFESCGVTHDHWVDEHDHHHNQLNTANKPNPNMPVNQIFPAIPLPQHHLR